MPDNNKLRFAIMCPGTQLSVWQTNCISELIDSGLAESMLLIQPTTQETIKKGDGIRRQLNMLPFRLFNRLRVNRKSNALRIIELDDTLGSLPVLRCDTVKKEDHGEQFHDKDIISIKSKKLDFILHFAFGNIEGDILQSAKYGVWSFHHGDDRSYRGSPAGSWECYNKDPLTGVVLQRLNGIIDGGYVLFRGSYNTNTSYTRNIDRIYLNTTYFPTRVCKAIVIGEYTEEPSQTSARIYHPPKFHHMIIYFCNRFFRYLKSLWLRTFYLEIWNIGFVAQKIDDFMASKKLGSIQWVNLPNAKKGDSLYIADPSGYEENRKLHVLFEEFPYKSAKGFISHLVLPDAFNKIEKTTIIDRPEHLSFTSNCDCSK